MKVGEDLEGGTRREIDGGCDRTERSKKMPNKRISARWALSVVGQRLPSVGAVELPSPEVAGKPLGSSDCLCYLLAVKVSRESQTV